MAADTAVMHEGVFEYEVVDGRALAVTLLRCVGTISRERIATRPFPAGPDVPTPLAQMIGETAFSSGGHGRTPSVRELLPHWERFALPMVSAPAVGRRRASGERIAARGVGRRGAVERSPPGRGARGSALEPADRRTGARDRRRERRRARAGADRDDRGDDLSETFDAIVVGGGVMGTAAAHELAMRGRNTLLLERFTFGHGRGSSGGPTRIFRFTYEHPDYVRMAGPALDAWRELEDLAGERLLHTTGGIDIGEGSRRSADALEAAGSPFAWLGAEATMERWPGLVIAPGTPVLVQESGGVCMAERTVRAQARLAAEAGATVREETAVEAIHPGGGGRRGHDHRRRDVPGGRGGGHGRAVGRAAPADGGHRPPPGSVVRAGDVLPAGRSAAAVPDDHRLDGRVDAGAPQRR